MSRRAINSSDWLSYGRSFLMTLGILFLALPCWIWRKQGDRSSEWPSFAWALFYGLVAFGAVLLIVALLASRKSVDKWADAVSPHEASIVVMIIAAPVYFVLKWFTRKK
jgi:hypothetical protein